MFLSPNESDIFYWKAEFFSTQKLHALDEYWSKNCSHPIHEKIHKIIESILIERGEMTLRDERLNHINALERSFSISNPMGRLSAHIIGIVSKILLKKKLH